MADKLVYETRITNTSGVYEVQCFSRTRSARVPLGTKTAFVPGVDAAMGVWLTSNNMDYTKGRISPKI